MNSVVEQIGPCKKLLRIEITPQEISERLDREFKELQGTAQVPGFRRGRVPLMLLQKRYKEQVSGEVKTSLMTESYEAALKDNALTPVAEPEFPQGLPELEEGKPLVFEVKVEVAPVIDLPPYKKLKVGRRRATVAEEEVEAAIQALRERDARQIPVDDGRVQKDNAVVCDLDFRLDGGSVWSQRNVGIWVSGDHIGPLKVGNLPELLEGVRVGETRTAPVTFPADAADEKLRGKSGELLITIREIKRVELPELSDQWTKERFRVDTVELLRERAKTQILERKEWEAQRDTRRALVNQLLEKTNFDMPLGVLAQEAQRARVRYRMQLLYEGLAPQEIEKEVEKFTQASEEWASRSLKRYFLLREIAKKEGLLATETDVEAWIEVMARNRGISPAAMRKQLQNEDGLSALRLQILESKTLNFLVEHAEVQETEGKPTDEK